MIVADAGPIVAFARIGRLDLLRQVFGEIVIPRAVYDDLAVRGKGRPGAHDAERAEWIRRKDVKDGQRLAELPRELGQGEREAILLAQEEGAQLLIDDQKAREVAIQMRIEVIGTLRVLAEAKRRGVVPEVRPIIKELVSAGYWMHEERLVRPFLREIGEEHS